MRSSTRTYQTAESRAQIEAKRAAARKAEVERARLRAERQEAVAERDKLRQPSAFNLEVADHESGLLTPGYEEFAREITLGRPTVDAWGQAFSIPYNKRIAQTILEDPIMITRVRQLHRQKLRLDATARRQAIENANLTREWVISRLMTVARLGTGETVQLHNDDGEVEFLKGRYDPSGANKALELLGREVGMFTEVPKEPKTPVERLSDDELIDEIERLRQRQMQIGTGTANGEGHRLPFAPGDGAEGGYIDVRPEASAPDDGRRGRDPVEPRERASASRRA